MRRFKTAPQNARRVKAIVAAAMALTLAVPTTAYLASGSSKAKAEGAGPEPVASVNFDKGFMGELKAHGLKVVKSEEMICYKEYLDDKDNYIYKDGSLVYDVTDTPFIEASEYKYNVKGNQPTTVYDDAMGTVLFFDDTVNEPDFFKKVEDEMKKIPIGTQIQFATVAHSQVQMDNPFKGKDLSNGASVSYWVKATPSKDDASKGANSTLVVFGVRDEDFKKVKTEGDGSAKAAEKEAESKLSIQLTTNNDFHYVNANNDKSVAYAGDGSVLAAPDTWKYVTVTMTDNKVVTYVDGAEVSSKDEDYAGLTAALTDSNTGVFFGGNYSTAAESVQQNVGTVRGTCMDDIEFYTSALTADEAKAVYDRAVASRQETGTVGDRVKAAEIETFDFENGMTGSAGTTMSDLDTNKEMSSIVEDNQKGNVLRLGNGTASKSSSVALSKNPFAAFADKDINGASINYWVREPENTNGDIVASISVSFVDTPKIKDHDKIAENYYKKESQTVLYTQTDMEAMFCEGFTTGCYTSLKNTYQFSTKKNEHIKDDKDSAGNIIDPYYDLDAVEKQKKYNENLKDMKNWHMITAVFTNAGIKMYRDGEPLSNNKAAADDLMDIEKKIGRPTYFGPRFYDGSYQTIYDGYAPWYRASNNQGATPLMTFLTDPTTSAYVGLMYKQETNDVFARTYEAYYDDITYYSKALTDEEVKYLKDGQEELPSVEPGVSEEPTPTPEQTKAPDANNGIIVATPVIKNPDGSITAEGPGVKLDAPAGVLPEKFSLLLGTLGTQTDAASYDAFRAKFAAIEDYTINDGFIIYSVTSEDATIAPNGTFKLTFAIPEGYDTSALVVIDENGKEYAVTVSVDGKTVSIEGVDHFGKFALAVKNLSTDDESVIASKAAYSGKTGDTANIVLPVVILAAAGAAFVAASKKRKADAE